MNNYSLIKVIAKYLMYIISTLILTYFIGYFTHFIYNLFYK
jgi:hypothetical protein